MCETINVRAEENSKKFRISYSEQEIVLYRNPAKSLVSGVMSFDQNYSDREVYLWLCGIDSGIIECSH